MENNNNNGVGSSSLDFTGSLKPFVEAGIASLLTEFFCKMMPLGVDWVVASGAKNEELMKPLNSRINLKTQLKIYRATWPICFSLDTITFGSFESLTRKAIDSNEGRPLSFYQEIGCGLLASTIGFYATAPYISAKKLMWADSGLPVEKRVNYRNIYDAFHRISTKEGISALWTRNTSMAIPFILSRTAMFASYHRSLGYFEGLYGSDGTRACFAAGAVSGFFQSIFLLPPVNVGMRMRTMKPNSQGKYPYTSYLDCRLKILKFEGLFSLYGGFLWSIPVSTMPIMMMWWNLKDIKEFEEHF
ncbi:hypothetical protein JCGZ_01860 [Jatropha curcas]|uniref:Uncharacterized protein n=1 Tax=Jatropha curcas TaxID=180498 RepID=A0A067L0W4_JATCU|nr:mitochondrial dicarboxylate/tricarboxylate transporter DTC [Jatropha curcas]KDP42072.1 hypothetical protein JCGZ_01860 [Jatropha curcas]